MGVFVKSPSLHDEAIDAVAALLNDNHPYFEATTCV